MRTTLLAALSSVALAQAPQANQIVMTRVFPQPGQIGLFLAAADGSNERPLVTPADLDYDATWAPDGSAIVFTSERNGSADLYRVKADGSGLERLTDSPAYDHQAAFSPDGQATRVRQHARGRHGRLVDDGSYRRAPPNTADVRSPAETFCRHGLPTAGGLRSHRIG